MRTTSQGRPARARAVAFLAIALVGAAAACDSRAAARIAAPPSACTDTTTSVVTMSPATVTLTVGDSVRVSATAGCVAVGTFSFSSTNPGVASVNAGTGIVRALARGDATITATSTVNPLVQGTTLVTVR